MAAPVVETPLGRIGGIVLTTWTGKDIFAYRGIRYAKAPVGDLRFKPPVPVEPWTGILNATIDGPMCPQPGATQTYGSALVSEDCLHVNVYTKEVSSAYLPVIVFFHSGGWFSGTNRSDWLGPDYLLDEDILLVTVNYRLGPLGFLSTNDEHAVGNYGMKDQVLALKWVKHNISAFGGNPNNVTISGYSAGSISVMLHMLSPMSNGLFSRGIAMGAGVTSNSMVTKNSLELTKKLSNVVGCPPTSSTRELIESLRKIPAETLANAYSKMKEWANDPMVIFSPIIEPDIGSVSDRFLSDVPKNIILSKQFAQVPLVTGITRDEFDFRGKVILGNPSWLNDVNVNFEKIAPIIFGYERGTERSKEISKKVRQFYLSDEPISKDNSEFGKIFSDSQIIFYQQQSAKLFAQHNNAPVYYYMTTYNGRFSYAMDGELKKPLGVVHQDELIYLFYNSNRFPKRFSTTDPEAKIVKRFCKMWANFATKSDPMPDDEPTVWNPLKSDILQYLEISDNLSMKPGLPFPERMALWETIYS